MAIRNSSDLGHAAKPGIRVTHVGNLSISLGREKSSPKPCVTIKMEGVLTAWRYRVLANAGDTIYGRHKS